MPDTFPKLYAITDRSLSGLSHAEQVDRLCVGGARLIQLRDKQSSSIAFYEDAKSAVHVARTYGARVLINDRVDIALAVGADGVHLGQTDLPPNAARRLLGDKSLLGLSTHNLEQFRQAIELPIDYVAFGPIFSTKTKANPDPEVGLQGLHQVRALTTLPIVAIGGITLENAADLLSSGADSIALIRALLVESDSISSHTRQLLATLGVTAP